MLLDKHPTTQGPTRERERDRETERQRERQRQRQRDRQRDRQREGGIGRERERDRQTQRQAGRQMERQRQRGRKKTCPQGSIDWLPFVIPVTVEERLWGKLLLVTVSCLCYCFFLICSRVGPWTNGGGQGGREGWGEGGVEKGDDDESQYISWSQQGQGEQNFKSTTGSFRVNPFEWSLWTK